MSVKSAILSYREGPSDKVYQAQIEAQGDGFVVNFQFGRRGATLQTGSKTANPVPLANAEKLFNQVVMEKTRKGYLLATFGESPVVQVPKALKSDDIEIPAPMLLNPLEESALAGLIRNPLWVMQEKMDGQRRSIIRKGDQIIGGNRNAEAVPVSRLVANAILNLDSSDFVLDGEIMGDLYHPFDILRFEGKDLRNLPYERRLGILHALIENAPVDPAIRKDRSMASEAGKLALFESIFEARGEGVVFKKADSKYVSGRPSRGGNALKFKFLASATVLVKALNAKRSVAIEVPNGKIMVAIGNVTIPPNHHVPSVGSFIEVEYMNIFHGGHLYQPVYKGERDDKKEADGYSSLKFKAKAA